MMEEVIRLMERRRDAMEKLKDNADFQDFLAIDAMLYQYMHAPRTAAAPKTVLPIVAPASRAADAAKSAGSRKSKTHELKEQVGEILRRAHKPMATREIVGELARRGVKIGGRNPVTNLSAKLSADARFKNERREGWRIDGPTKPIPMPMFLRPSA